MNRPIAFAIDVVLVIAFAAIGRLAHHEGLDPMGMAQTSWPFLVGLVFGWMLIYTLLRRLSPLQQGALVWLDTIIVGMLLRLATGQGVQAAFIMVATVMVGIFLLGWRFIYWLIRGRTTQPNRRRSAS